MIESVGQASKNSGTARTRHRNIISQECRADHFRRRATEDIERQKSERWEEEHIEPVVEHLIPKRTQLVKVICTHVAGITPQDIVKHRVHSAGAYCSGCSPR